MSTDVPMLSRDLLMAAFERLDEILKDRNLTAGFRAVCKRLTFKPVGWWALRILRLPEDVTLYFVCLRTFNLLGLVHAECGSSS